jgi:Ca2+-binding RTX toxin-like protein
LYTAHLATGVLAAVSALGVPPGATSTCSYDAAGATLNVQMLAPRVVIRAGGETLEVIGTAGPDHYRAMDDLGASLDLDGDGDPDVLSTDAARVVLLGGPGADVLRASRSGRDRLDGGPGNDRIFARGAAGDTLIGGSGFDSVRADVGDVVIGFERQEQP